MSINEASKNVALIIARLSSSRLPKKNIMPICGKPMIEQLINRIKGSKFINEIVITTSDHCSDDELELLASRIGVKCFRGSLHDVMQRTIDAALAEDAVNIIEILGDNPLIHYSLIDDVADLFLNTNVDYAATATNEYKNLPEHVKRFAVGIRVQIYSLNAALRYKDFSCSMDKDSHPSSFIFENPNEFKLQFLEASNNWEFLNIPEINFAVNYPKNFIFSQKVFQKFIKQGYPFTLNQLIECITEEPKLLNLLGHEEGFDEI